MKKVNEKKYIHSKISNTISNKLIEEFDKEINEEIIDVNYQINESNHDVRLNRWIEERGTKLFFTLDEYN